jgi:pectinesterase
MRSFLTYTKHLALLGGSIVLTVAQAVTSTASRPQLSSSDAANFTIAKYLAQTGTVGSLITDNWDPTGGVGTVSTFTANYKVTTDGTSPYSTIQSAIDAAVAGGGGSVRKYISVQPGIYTGMVCVPASAPPITLYGLSGVSGNTVIVFGNANPMTKTVGVASNPCAGNASAATIGTVGSATALVLAPNFQARDLTFKNSYVEGTVASPNQSAVALAVRGDKTLFENVSVIGNQDSLYIGATNGTTVMRAYFKGSFIQGDTDFIFGPGTAVFHGGTIQSTGARVGTGGTGYVFAPSTQPGNAHGFLAVGSTFNYTGGATSGSVYLGRAWDQGVSSASSYLNDSSPNGQVVIRDSILDAHVRLGAPWGTSTSGRPYCFSNCSYSANRFFEYSNTGIGSGN